MVNAFSEDATSKCLSPVVDISAQRWFDGQRQTEMKVLKRTKGIMWSCEETRTWQEQQESWIWIRGRLFFTQQHINDISSNNINVLRCLNAVDRSSEMGGSSEAAWRPQLCLVRQQRAKLSAAVVKSLWGCSPSLPGTIHLVFDHLMPQTWRCTCRALVVTPGGHRDSSRVSEMTLATSLFSAPSQPTHNISSLWHKAAHFSFLNASHSWLQSNFSN